MRLAALPPGAAVLESVAAQWLGNAGDLPLAVTEGLILLPTRRAARSLAEAFLRVSGGRPLLLPRIVALGALDEAPLALTGALDLPPAVVEAERLAVLARLVMAAEAARGRSLSAERAWVLARELAQLLDEAERAEIDLARALPDLAPARYAEHWQTTLTFLAIVTEAWPAWLAERRLMNPTARRIALLDATTRSFRENPPRGPTWAIASGGESPAEARLLGAIANLPRGLVLLPALDREMADEHWNALAIDQPEHAESGTARLLGMLGATRGDVAEFPARSTAIPQGRAAMLRRALLPAPALYAAWRSAPAPALDGLFRLNATDQRQEALAIAMVLRNALETPGARAALITPDRELARRVSAELLRFGIVADDSAGEALGETPPAVFLRLLAEAVAARFAPLPLLALMKHPLCALGLAPAEARRGARALERAVLRGPGPAPGLASLAEAAARAGVGEDLVGRLERALAPLERARAGARVAPATLLAALVEAAEALAATDQQAGPARLWAFEEGEALAAHTAELLAALGTLPAIPPDELGGLFTASLEGAVVRSRRMLRGRGGTEHPRVFIWGLLEARLQSVEVAVLGGLTEGVWPPATDPGPWLSRPMRVALGLPSTEATVGRAAQDFLSATLAAPKVVLASPRRREGAPAVPARWLVRLAAMLRGSEAEIPLHPALGWAGALDRPAGPARPALPPAPKPPLALRPRRLSVSEIATWVADPYAIYAKHVLGLAPLPEIAEAADAADFGILVHKALADFFDNRCAWPPNAAELLAANLVGALREAKLPPYLEAWWGPRLRNIARAVAAIEATRRCDAEPRRVATERQGTWEITVGNHQFSLVGRADRIEWRADGGLAILDYKTGHVPEPKEIALGKAPQLCFEAAMAEAGAFGAEFQGVAAELAYIGVNGRTGNGKHCVLQGAEATAATEEAARGLRALIARFDDPTVPYLARPHPGNQPSHSDYDQLARVAEWGAADE